MKGHGAFNLHYLLDNPFTADDFRNFAIRYNVYNGEPINIGDKRNAKVVKHSSMQSQPAEKMNEEMDVDSSSNPDISVDPSAGAELNLEGSTREQIVTDVLKSCFDSDRRTRSKIETQIHAMFPDNSGMIQVLL